METGDVNIPLIVGGAGALVFFIVIMFLVPLRLWVGAKAAPAGVSIATLIAMRLRRVPPNTVVEARHRRGQGRAPFRRLVQQLVPIAAKALGIELAKLATAPNNIPSTLN